MACCCPTSSGSTPRPGRNGSFRWLEAAGISTEGVAAQEVALSLAERVRELADEVGVPSGLTALGVTEAVLPRLARTALKDACLSTNPREADARDIEAIFRAAL